jgi:perosamine synthetase
MVSSFIPVSEPELGDEELANVVSAVRSGWISSLGPFVVEFEHEFAGYCGARHGIATSNGTTALHLALVATGVGPGDEVLVPTLTFVATANAVRYCGGVPVFVDATPDTWTMATTALESRITSRTRAIVPVHLYGHPCDMEPILDVARRHGLAVIEDAAEAHGAEYRGQRVGALGTIGAFSFYGNKIMTTGEGGMCLTDDGVLAERMRLLRDHGMDPKRHYWHEVVGFNYRMTNVQAAIGAAQVKKLPRFVDKKREIAGWYQDALAPLAGSGRIHLAPEASWARNAFWMYSIVLADPDLSRDAVRARMKELGVDSRPFFHPVHTLPPYAEGQCLPVSESLAAAGLNLPSGGRLQRADVNAVVEALSAALEG